MLSQSACWALITLRNFCLGPVTAQIYYLVQRLLKSPDPQVIFRSEATLFSHRLTARRSVCNAMRLMLFFLLLFKMYSYYDYIICTHEHNIYLTRPSVMDLISLWFFSKCFEYWAVTSYLNEFLFKSSLYFSMCVLCSNWTRMVSLHSRLLLSPTTAWLLAIWLR